MISPPSLAILLRRAMPLVVAVVFGSFAHAQTSSEPSSDIEARLRRLEEANQRLLKQNQELMERFEKLSKTMKPPETAPPEKPSAGTSENASKPNSDPGPSPPTRSEGGTGRGETLPNLSTPKGAASKPPAKTPATVTIGPGVLFESKDGEYTLQIRNLTQFEFRGFQQGGQASPGGFDIPRERLYFQGRVTKPIEYEASFEFGYGNAQILNAYINFHYDDRAMLKVGRYKVPFGYEYYAVTNMDMIQPERSLFGLNFGLNRELGGQIFGQVWEKRIDYAVGIFNGPRNQFVDFNADKDVIAYANVRPFQEDEDLPALKYFNVGGSVAFGSQNNPVYPVKLTTSVQATTNATALSAAPAFLAFNSGTLEKGDRALWSLHSAYYYKGLSLIAEWQSGFEDFGRANQITKSRIPIEGYYVTGGYFITGETVERRTTVKPLRPFDLRPGKFGPGAIELTARYSLLDINSRIFTDGFSDPNLWANRVYATDLGLNWYLNQYTRITLDWQHAEFNQPALFAQGRRQLTSDLFWLKFQVYF